MEIAKLYKVALSETLQYLKRGFLLESNLGIGNSVILNQDI